MGFEFVEFFQLLRLLGRGAATGFARHRGFGFVQVFVLGIAGVEERMLLWRVRAGGRVGREREVRLVVRELVVLVRVLGMR